MTPYKKQIEAAQTATNVGRGLISMVTGYGKSYTMALLIEKLQVKTLVVVPNLELKSQLTKTFETLFGVTTNIVVENIDSSRLGTLTNFDALIIDECHHAASETYHRLNRTSWQNIYYRYAFTATPFRANSEETILMTALTGPVIYAVSYKDAVSDGAIVPVEAYYVDVPAQKPKGNQNSWASMYSELVVNNPHRNNLAIRLIRALEGIPTLTLVKEVKHGENIAIETNRPFAHGMAENTRQLILEFCVGEIDSLIGTTGVIGEGIDTKPAEYVLLLGGGKSKTQFIQQVGRVVRRYKGKESGKVILFKDCSHKWMLQHYKEQVKILKEEYGIKPVRLEI